MKVFARPRLAANTVIEYNKYYTELKEVKDADGFTVTFGLDKSMEEAGEITGLDDYSCVTIIYNASK